MKRLTRLGLVVILAAGAGGGLYYGWPIVRDRYITPVETTATDVATVKERIDRTDAQISDLTETVAGIDASLELLAATDSRQDQSLAQIGARLDSLEDSIGTQTARISALESVSAALQADVAAAADSSTEQVQELLAAEYLSRARLFLYQANYGLAAQDVGAAITLLSPLEPNATRESVVERLGSVVSELPDRPVLAADDLDIAWYTLLGGLTPQPEPIAD